MVAGRLKSLDWKFIRSSSINSIAFAVGRVLGFAFTFIVARGFSSSDFGYVMYVLALGQLLAIIVQPFHQHVFAYFIGRYSRDEEQLQRTMGNIWLLSVSLMVLSVLVGIPILLLLNRFDPTVLFVFAGTALFYLYWGIATGNLKSLQLVFAFISSNVVQAVLVLFIVLVFKIDHTGPVIAVYGLSYFAPIALLSWAYPLKISFKFAFDLVEIKRILRFSLPVWASHMLYQVQMSVGVILLEYFHGTETVGIYSLTTTLAQVFSFVTQGITLILMPKLAGMEGGRKALVAASLTVTFVADVIGLLLYLAVYKWFVITFFDAEYFLSLNFALIRAIGVILFGFHSVFTSSFVGIGKPVYETVSRVVIAVLVLLAGLVLIPSLAERGAAWAQIIGALAGVAVYVYFIVRMYSSGKSIESYGRTSGTTLPDVNFESENEGAG